eukprot:3852448-Rhodomonas_salina.1
MPILRIVLRTSYACCLAHIPCLSSLSSYAHPMPIILPTPSYAHPMPSILHTLLSIVTHILRLSSYASYAYRPTHPLSPSPPPLSFYALPASIVLRTLYPYRSTHSLRLSCYAILTPIVLPPTRSPVLTWGGTGGGGAGEGAGAGEREEADGRQ